MKTSKKKRPATTRATRSMAELRARDAERDRRAMSPLPSGRSVLQAVADHDAHYGSSQLCTMHDLGCAGALGHEGAHRDASGKPLRVGGPG